MLFTATQFAFIESSLNVVLDRTVFQIETAPQVSTCVKKTMKNTPCKNKKKFGDYCGRHKTEVGNVGEEPTVQVVVIGLCVKKTAKDAPCKNKKKFGDYCGRHKAISVVTEEQPAEQVVEEPVVPQEQPEEPVVPREQPVRSPPPIKVRDVVVEDEECVVDPAMCYLRTAGVKCMNLKTSEWFCDEHGGKAKNETCAIVICDKDKDGSHFCKEHSAVTCVNINNTGPCKNKRNGSGEYCSAHDKVKIQEAPSSSKAVMNKKLSEIKLPTFKMDGLFPGDSDEEEEEQEEEYEDNESLFGEDSDSEYHSE